jgi:hypothetical protein
MRILPTICTQRWRVSFVCSHSSRGNGGSLGRVANALLTVVVTMDLRWGRTARF